MTEDDLKVPLHTDERRYVRLEDLGTPEWRRFPISRRELDRAVRDAEDAKARAEMLHGLLVAGGILVFVGLLFLFSGCASVPPGGAQARCETCIGVYDLTLRSHREALGLRP